MYNQVELYMEPEEILDKMSEGYCEMSPAEQGFLCGLIKKYCPHKIVEVGVAGGGTTAVVMKCLDMIHSDAKMYSVDLREQCYRREDKITGYQLEEVREELQNYSNHKFLLGHILPKVIDEIGNEPGSIFRLILIWSVIEKCIKGIMIRNVMIYLTFFIKHKVIC